MTDRQENFENRVILESDLGYKINNDGQITQKTLDDMNYTELKEMQLEKGRDLTDDDKQLRSIFVWFKLRQLTEEERTLAWKYFVEGKTEKQISEEMRFVINDNASEKKGSKSKITQRAISYRIKNLRKKLNS